MLSAIGHFAEGLGHDISHGAGDVVHGTEDAGKAIGHAATSTYHTVTHAASSAAHTVTHAASSAAHGLFNDGKHAFSSVERSVAGAAKTAVKGLGKAGSTLGKAAGSLVKDGKEAEKSASSFLGGVWNSVAQGGGSLLHGVEHGASSLVNGAKSLGKTVVNGLDSGYHDLRHDAKSGLIDAAGFANKLGLGHVMDDLGLGGVNQKNVQMNHHITQTYYHQSKELQGVLGKGSGANWATFASWASNRAGQAIQNHDDPGGRTGRDADQLLCDVPGPVADLLGGPLGGAAKSQACGYNKFYENESNQAAAGNQKVFHDIDPHIQNFIDTFKGVKAPDQQKWNQFASSFHGKEGDMLAGFKSYYNAMFQSGSQKAQSITAGNLQLGLHEQKLLQSNIAGAFPPGQGATYTAGQKVRVGNQVLTLNHNVTSPSGTGGQGYPSDLQNITNPQLKQLLNQYGTSSGTLQGSGAQDWTNLPDRMKFISGLFLSHYNDPSLFQDPLNTNPMG